MFLHSFNIQVTCMSLAEYVRKAYRNKGNNKITELRAILQMESQHS